MAGWSYQWIYKLNWAPDSWTAPLDAPRITPSMDAGDATVDQVKRLVGLLPSDDEIPLFVFDAGYDGIALGEGLKDTRAQVLVRIASTRVFPPDPEAHREGAVGRPRRHGPRFVLADEESWTTPDAELATFVLRYGKVTITAGTTSIRSGHTFRFVKGTLGWTTPSLQMPEQADR